MKGKHDPLIDQDLFDRVQEVRRRNTTAPKNYPRKTSITSLTGLVRCWKCKGRMHVGFTSRGRRHYACYNRIQGNECDQKAVPLDVLEDQIEAYLRQFRIPEDYQQRIIEGLEKLEAAYDDVAQARNRLDGHRGRRPLAWRGSPAGKGTTILRASSGAGRTSAAAAPAL